MKAILFLVLPALLVISCATDEGSATPGYYRPGSPGDGVSKFGVFIAPTKQPEIIVAPAK